MIRIIGPRDKKITDSQTHIINTCSHDKTWSRGLSPFILGPCSIGDIQAKNVENGWQFSKVYPDQTDSNGKPLPSWYEWHKKGCNSSYASRYPKGKGAIPLYSYFNNDKLNYIEARKLIYIPLYVQAVKHTDAYQTLKGMYEQGRDIVLWDFDGYDHIALNMTFDQVLHDPTRKMGHAFVLAMMLTHQM